MEIIIRKAIKQDCPRLLELIRELAIYEKAEAEVSVSLDHFTESGFGENPVWWAFVASPPLSHSTGGNIVGADHIIGLALYYIRYSTWKGQLMYLEDIIVTENERGKGVGKLLFDRLVEEAKEKRFSGIVWQVLEWNKPAIHFYGQYNNVVFDEEWINCAIRF